MKRSRLAGEIMSALIYGQALLVFAGVAGALMHGGGDAGAVAARPAVEAAQPL